MLRRFCVAVACVAFGIFDARAADLSAIKRVIVKEPAYQGKPRYCMLVFGPEANTRIWIVRDDRHLYVDRLGAGDLTAAGVKVDADPNRIANLANIGAANRKNLSLYTMGNHFRLTFGQRGGGNTQYVGIGLMERPVWGDKAENAPIIHFDGPMALARYGPAVNVPRAASHGRSTSLRLMVGTPGLGQGTFASYDELCSENLGPIQAEITYTSAADKSKTFTDRCELVHDG